ncbi:MAG TPA: TIM44-like domain-containing protein [Pseudomonas sp.]|nr:TIM44-like domain-containing protein [Pseudomonas sp.]
MQRFLSLALALCLSLTLSIDAFAAKRFGGGKSFGAAPMHQTQAQPRQFSQPQATPAPGAPSAPLAGASAAGAAAGAMAKPAGASRWLGPLAGIAAGGLLASLFMGHGFQGFQLLDFLILALVAFVAFRLFARRKAQHAAPAYSGMGSQAYQAPVPPQPQAPAANPAFGGSAAPAARRLNAPAWFDEQRFVGVAREHFMNLQQHWDAAELNKIAEYVTPQMLAFLQEERASLGDGFQSTYIDDLQVQLDGVDQQAGKTIATLTFSGVSKTSRFDQGEPFSESWRMERSDGANQPWLIAGIRQNG